MRLPLAFPATSVGASQVDGEGIDVHMRQSKNHGRNTNLLGLLRTDGFARFVQGNRGRNFSFNLSQPLEQRLVLGAEGNHLCRAGGSERGVRRGRTELQPRAGGEVCAVLNQSARGKRSFLLKEANK